MSTWFVDGIKKIRNDDIIIGFVGSAGAGKSHFVDLLTGQLGRRTCHSLNATTTQGVNAVRVKHPTYGDRIVLVDTPGFNESVRSPTQVQQMINRWLQKTYKKSIKLNGLVYLHRITDNRITKPLEDLCLFRELCGDSALTQVVLVSTMWEDLLVDDGVLREKELEMFHWKSLIERGSKVDRLTRSDPVEAWRIVEQLVRGNDARAVARLQEELLRLGSALQYSRTGRALQDSLQKALTEQKSSLRHVLAQSRKPSEPQLSKKFAKEYARCESQTRKALEEIRKSKFDIGVEVAGLFCGKNTRGIGIKVESP